MHGRKDLTALTHPQSPPALGGANALSPTHSERSHGDRYYGDSGSEIPIRRTSALEPDHSHFSLLRESALTCERCLTKAYEDRSVQARLQAKHGLSIATGRRLRRLFGNGNVTDCRRALEPWNLRRIVLNTA